MLLVAASHFSFEENGRIGVAISTIRASGRGLPAFIEISISIRLGSHGLSVLAAEGRPTLAAQVGRLVVVSALAVTVSRCN